MLSLGLSVGNVIFINPLSQYEVLPVPAFSVVLSLALCWRLGVLRLLGQP
jgi:hypothetical protein